ncbi:recombinase family protein [Gordonia paraffinivorans]|uniref:recombinase family protein n=1 Tax=Gordonia paraffinivorans TaxID=175628 RepID=UPI0014457162|nr:recombinase family protein [Gordonia paraffinivorans]
MTSAGRLIGYRRVSSADQNADRQLEDLISSGAIDFNEVFTDKASGKSTDRPKLAEALRYVRPGETLVVHSMDRLGRNLRDLDAIVEALTKGGEVQVGAEAVHCKGGARVRFVKENLTFTGDAGDWRDRLLFQMLGAIAEMEREMIRERQREGITLAKAKGVYKGGKPKLTANQTVEVARRVAAGESVASLAREFHVSRQTVYRYAAQAKNP